MDNVPFLLTWLEGFLAILVIGLGMGCWILFQRYTRAMEMFGRFAADIADGNVRVTRVTSDRIEIEFKKYPTNDKGN